MASSTPSTAPGDLITVGAIAVVVACVVAFDHEAVGHGTACLAFGGHIALLTSVYFRCTAASAWIAVAGPAGNLLMGSKEGWHDPMGWVALAGVVYVAFVATLGRGMY